jgi:hypothetical protein
MIWYTKLHLYTLVVDLSTNQMNIYPTRGIISKYDENYTAFYTDTDGYIRRIYLPDDINC